jgi:DNA-binding NtrC family response regulator
VRELRNVLERAMILSPDGRLSLELPAAQPNSPEDFFQMRLFPGLSLQEATDELAKSLCLNALRVCKGNKKAAALMLGISRDSLYRLLRRLGLKTED